MRAYPSASNCGFSLIELIIVLTLMMIVGSVAYMAWPNDDFNVSAQAESLASDIRYAQSLSTAKNERYRVDFTNPSQYQILDSTGTAIVIPAVNATTVTFPTGITQTSVINYLVFDTHGTPYSSTTSNGSGTVLTGNLIIVVSGTLGTKQILVESETGGVFVQ